MHSNPLSYLTHLRRTGTVEDYQEQFSMLLVRCIFIAGLFQPKSIDVEMQKLESLEDAMALIRAYECRNQVANNATRTMSRSPRFSREGRHVRTLATQDSGQTGSNGLYIDNARCTGQNIRTAKCTFTRLSPKEMA